MPSRVHGVAALRDRNMTLQRVGERLIATRRLQQ
jgi:hypothetical protein